MMLMVMIWVMQIMVREGMVLGDGDCGGGGGGGVIAVVVA